MERARPGPTSPVLVRELTLSGWDLSPDLPQRPAEHHNLRATIAHLVLGLSALTLFSTVVVLSWQPPTSWTPLITLGLLALLAQYFPVHVSYANVSVGVGFLLAACLLGGAIPGAVVVASVYLLWSATRRLLPWYRHTTAPPRLLWIARVVSFTGISGLSYLVAAELAFSVFELQAPVGAVTLASLGASVVMAVSVYILQNLTSLLISLISGEDVLGYLQTVIPIPALAEFLSLPAALLLAVAEVSLGGSSFALLSWLYLLAALLGWRSCQDREILKRRLEDVELLHRVGGTLSGTLEIGELVRRMNDILREVVRFEAMLLAINDSAEHSTQCYVFDGSGRRGDLSNTRLGDTDWRDEGLVVGLDGNAFYTRDLQVGEGASVTLRLDFSAASLPSSHRVALLDTICQQSGTALANARLYRMANTDPLTRVAIRRYFERALRLTAANGEHFAVIMLDLDWFKRVNDTYGHRAGDWVLRDLAVVLVGSLRVLDVPARYGGEEFVLLLPGATSPEGVAVAERIRRTLERRRVAVDDLSLVYTASFGVAASTDVDPAADPMEVVWKADAALLEAKRAGRNQVVAYAALTDKPRRTSAPDADSTRPDDPEAPQQRGARLRDKE